MARKPIHNVTRVTSVVLSNPASLHTIGFDHPIWSNRNPETEDLAEIGKLDFVKVQPPESATDDEIKAVCTLLESRFYGVKRLPAKRTLKILRVERETPLTEKESIGEAYRQLNVPEELKQDVQKRIMEIYKCTLLEFA